MEKLVFVSHAREADGEKADRIVEYLESHGIGCFIAPRDITKGASYAPKLVAGIDAATVVLLIGTPAIVGREHILNEIEIAVNKHKTIVQFVIEDYTRPTTSSTTSAANKNSSRRRAIMRRFCPRSNTSCASRSVCPKSPPGKAQKTSRTRQNKGVPIPFRPRHHDQPLRPAPQRQLPQRYVRHDVRTDLRQRPPGSPTRQARKASSMTAAAKAATTSGADCKALGTKRTSTSSPLRRKNSPSGASSTPTSAGASSIATSPSTPKTTPSKAN